MTDDEDSPGDRLGQFITRSHFSRLEATYGRKWGVELVLADGEGNPVTGSVPAGRSPADMRSLMRLHIAEAVRWGEPPFVLLPDGGMAWVAPVMLNMEVLGGVAAFMGRDRLLETLENSGRVRSAATELLEWLVGENLTNGSLLELRRGRLLHERRRAEAIHEYKLSGSDFRFLYLREEPGLMNAIRRGGREEARGILNKILVVLLYQAGDNLNLVKSFILEIITMMSRTAVEAGCDAGEVFGDKYEDFTGLSKIRSDDEFSPWLHDIMERLIDSIHRSRNRSPVPRMQAALDFMRENLAAEISRDEAAEAAHMSPSHFSRLFRRVFGENFSDRLNRMRVEHAAELLTRSDLGLGAVALDSGFKDQSYFTKVFRKYFDKTPGGYRRQMNPARLRSGRFQRSREAEES